MADKPQTCPDCGRAIDDCYVPVDPETWPAAAAEAFDLAGFSTAATCLRGQARDLRRTAGRSSGGWCIDRVVRHPDYRGEPIPGLQRDVQGFGGRRVG